MAAGSDDRLGVAAVEHDARIDRRDLQLHGPGGQRRRELDDARAGGIGRRDGDVGRRAAGVQPDRR